MRFTRRRFLGLAAGLATVAGASAYWSRIMPNVRYVGPVSDHFDGERFFDPDGAPPKGRGDLLRWQWEGGRAAWPAWAPSPFSDVPPARVTSGVRLSFVGHVSWLIQTAGLNILVDPVWSQRVSPSPTVGPARLHPVPIAVSQLPALSAVVISHDHYDHLDLATVRRLVATQSAPFLVPLGMGSMILNAAILAVAVVLFPLEAVLYTLVYVALSSRITDAVFHGLTKRQAAIIISDRWEEIARELTTDHRIGITRIDGWGGYQRTGKTILYSVINRKNMSLLKRVVLDKDPSAFIAIMTAEDVTGVEVGNQPHW